LTKPGNHDITLDTDFYTQYGLYFHNQTPQDPARCQELLEQSSSILWLKHEAVVVKLDGPSGPHTTFKIFGSPFSPRNGMWAFGYNPQEAVDIWNRIPLDSDIVLTHTPPKYHRDERKDRKAVGCEELRNTLWRVRPRLAVCGHVHEGRGAERIRWDLEASNIKYKEIGVEPWDDPGRDNKKLSLIDLTTRGRTPLDNDGSCSDLETWSSTNEPAALPPTEENHIELPTSLKQNITNEGISKVTTKLLPTSVEIFPPTTRGQGGIPPSNRCDMEALMGRLGRKETYVINAAIMASSWPHGAGGRKFNKPIVVDIDLPVWKE
jgi:hypothetical protein